MLLKNILDKYKALESRCDYVLGEGTDYTEVSSAFGSTAMPGWPMI